MIKYSQLCFITITNKYRKLHWFRMFPFFYYLFIYYLTRKNWEFNRIHQKMCNRPIPHPSIHLSCPNYIRLDHHGEYEHNLHIQASLPEYAENKLNGCCHKTLPDTILRLDLEVFLFQRLPVSNTGFFVRSGKVYNNSFETSIIWSM